MDGEGRRMVGRMASAVVAIVAVLLLAAGCTAGDRATEAGVDASRMTVEQARALLAASDDLPRVALSVFLEDTVSLDEQDEIDRTLRGLVDVTDVAFESQEDAFADAQTLFGDDPELLQGLRPSDLPASFRVDIAAGADAERVVAAVDDLPGVLEVGVGDDFLLRGDSSAELAADRLVLAWRADDRVSAEAAAVSAIADIFAEDAPRSGMVATCAELDADLAVCDYTLPDGTALSVLTVRHAAGWRAMRVVFG